MPTPLTSSRPHGTGAATLEPFEVLYDTVGDGGDVIDLPRLLDTLYVGSLRLPQPGLVGNVVSSIDGVVALDPEPPTSATVISRGNPADRFLMGLLRASADAVLIGSGTLRAVPRYRWRPEDACPWAGDAYAALRRQLGKPAAPRVVIVSGSGNLDPAEPVFEDPSTVVITTAEARTRSSVQFGAAATIVVGDADVDLRRAVNELRGLGCPTILTEGGPATIGHLLEDGLMDELFLTISPVLAGRDGGRRPGLAQGVALLPGDRGSAQLRSVRRHGDALFLRYRLLSQSAEQPRRRADGRA